MNQIDFCEPNFILKCQNVFENLQLQFEFLALHPGKSCTTKLGLLTAADSVVILVSLSQFLLTCIVNVAKILHKIDSQRGIESEMKFYLSIFAHGHGLPASSFLLFRPSLAPSVVSQSNTKCRNARDPVMPDWSEINGQNTSFWDCHILEGL